MQIAYWMKMKMTEAVHCTFKKNLHHSYWIDKKLYWHTSAIANPKVAIENVGKYFYSLVGMSRLPQICRLHYSFDWNVTNTGLVAQSNKRPNQNPNKICRSSIIHTLAPSVGDGSVITLPFRLGPKSHRKLNLGEYLPDWTDVIHQQMPRSTPSSTMHSTC